MNIQRNIEMHEKCIKILEMIKKCKKWISFSIEALERWDKATWDAPIRLNNTRGFIENQLESQKKILIRLNNYYENQLIRI